MTTWLDRLRKEQQDLEIKLDALDKFLQTEGSKNIDPNQLTLMKQQARIMASYNEVLAFRVELADTYEAVEVNGNKELFEGPEGIRDGEDEHCQTEEYTVNIDKLESDLTALNNYKELLDELIPAWHSGDNHGDKYLKHYEQQMKKHLQQWCKRNNVLPELFAN